MIKVGQIRLTESANGTTPFRLPRRAVPTRAAVWQPSHPNFNGGKWNNPIPIAPAPGSADPRSGVAAVSSHPGEVEVFWVRPDGMVFTNSHDPNFNAGKWNNPIPIAPAPG